MKNKIIYLLRHGETDYNRNGMVQGRGIDASLNEEGVKQAIKVYNELKHIAFDHIYTSSLKRTAETVQNFIKDGIPYQSHAGFDEISWGEQEGVRATLEDKAVYSETLDEWKKGNLNMSVGGGESPIEVMQRQQEAMDMVMKSEYKTILICMHGRAMRILLSWLLNYPLNFMDGFPHQNCGYYKLKKMDDHFSVSEFNITTNLF